MVTLVTIYLLRCLCVRWGGRGELLSQPPACSFGWLKVRVGMILFVYAFPVYFQNAGRAAAENLFILYIWDFYDRKAFFYRTADQIAAKASCCGKDMDSEQRHSFTNGVLFGVMLIYNAVVVSLALAECSEAGGDGCM